MSSILKALKKLEEEKDGRRTAHGPSPGGQYVAPPEPGQRNWLLLACGVGIGVLLAGGLFFFIGRPVDPPVKSEVAQVISSEPPAPKAAQVPPSVPVATSPQQQQPQSPAKATAVNQSVARQAPPVPVPRPQPVAVVAAPQSAEKPAAKPLPAPPAVAAEEVEQVQVKRREIPLPGQQWAAPQVAVSEILPDGGGGYMAIVNGLPVMDGTQVENAVVEKIFADRVRFVIDGKTVEVKPTPP